MERKTSQEKVTLELKGKFELTLPKEINVEPDWLFPVAKNWIMRVWRQTKKVRYSDKAEPHEETIYFYDVRHAATGRPNGNSRFDRWNGECRSLLDVRLTAENWAYELRPKTKTTRIDEDEE